MFIHLPRPTRPRSARHRMSLLAGAAAVFLAAVFTLVTGGTAQAASSACSYYGAFAWLDGQASLCLQGAGTWNTSAMGPETFLSNSTGVRVWFHQHADGSGWADCFSKGNAYWIGSGSRDQYPGNVQISTNSDQCGSVPYGVSQECAGQSSPFAWLEPVQRCYYTQHYNVKPNGFQYSILTNITGHRVWLHQNPDGSGWADCFTSGSAYYLAGTRDASPGDLFVSTNSSAC